MPIKPQPKITDSISVLNFYELYREQLKMKIVAGERGMKSVISEKSINRPALALTGYFKYFAIKRLQLFGAGEMGYLKSLDAERQMKIMTQIAERGIPCMIVSRNLVPTKAMFHVAHTFNIPLIRTSLISRDFTTVATVLLEEKFAPRLTEHGTLLDVQGIGVLLRGPSGVGKSECALALIERDHSLVADDIVYIKLMGERDLMGTSSALNRGYMECRGLGIVNIAELFGVRSVRLERRIDMVVSFVEWKPGMDEERTGLEESYYNILDIEVPNIELPVRPGRDMARLVEVAAMDRALKMMGHDSAKEFNDRLIAHMTGQTPKDL